MCAGVGGDGAAPATGTGAHMASAPTTATSRASDVMRRSLGVDPGNECAVLYATAACRAQNRTVVTCRWAESGFAHGGNVLAVARRGSRRRRRGVDARVAALLSARLPRRLRAARRRVVCDPAGPGRLVVVATTWRRRGLVSLSPAG